jgi:hypothetical protein
MLSGAPFRASGNLIAAYEAKVAQKTRLSAPAKPLTRLPQSW